MGDEYKFTRDAKLFIAIWDNTATNLKRSNVIECIENGADVNVRFANNANNTPLHVAVSKKERDVVNILLNYGANPNIVNDAGLTALQLAKELQCSDIVQMLVAQEEVRVKVDTDNHIINNKSFKAIGKYVYKKRPGTANVRGQLYETKLLTTIFLRALRCNQITQFYLGTNMDEIGDLDDVCLRLKTRNQDCVIFLQAKYKHDIVKGRLGVQDLWKSSGDFSLLKYFDSYSRIREKFSPDSNDEFFRGKYEDIKPYFIIYTTVKDDIHDTRKKAVADDIVNDLLGTGENQIIFQCICENQYVDALTNVKLIERIKNMGKKLITLIQEGKCDNMMFCDESIRSFHVILAQKVIKVTDVNSDGHRIGTFREEFFSSDEQFLIILREIFYAEIVKTNKLSEEEIETSVRNICIEPTADNISSLIGSVLAYDTNTSTLKETKEATGLSFSYQHILDSVQVAKSEIKEAFQIAGQRKLKKLVFKLPAVFGNLDITVNKKKAERRLEYLAGKICDVLIKTADEEGNVVLREGVFTSNKQLEEGILGINGGIASAVGNLLVSDGDNKLKFNLDMDTLGENARKLQLKLKDTLRDISKYRFQVDIEGFPRLSLQATEYEKRFARDFFKNLYFYTCQAKEENLEEIATKELQAHECREGFSKSESRIKSNAMFLKIHNEIQIWWLMEQSVHYLTRNMENFDKIFSYMKNKGLLLYLNILYLKDLYSAGLEFKADAVDILSVCDPETDDNKITVVHTEAHVLTCYKLVQYFKEMDNYTFVDIDYIYRVSPNCFECVLAELGNIHTPVVIIVHRDNKKSTYNIEDIINSCVAKKIILVTNNVIKYDCVVVKDNKIKLCDLTDLSQTIVLQTPFVYQGVEVTFAEVFNDAKHLIDAKILQKIISHDKITLGQKLESSTYEDMKHYYVPRVLELNVTSCLERISPSTLIDPYDLLENTSNKGNSNVVLILDAPGMGKSTLLTHLSLETKKCYPKIWIQRINLIDYTKQFHDWHQWQKNDIKINKIDIFKFLCKLVLSNDTFRGEAELCNSNTAIQIEIVNDELRTVVNNDEYYCSVKLLECNTFLNCYKEGNIIFLFDGFDEISPHYKSEVMELLKCLASRDQVSNALCAGDTFKESQTGNCVWITSRPYNDLKNTLETEFGVSFTLLPFSYYDTYVFVDKYMRRNLNLTMLTQGQLKNIDGFFEYMKRFDLRGTKQSKYTLNTTNAQLHGIYMAVVEYFKNEIKQTYLTNNLACVKHWDFEEDVLIVWELFKDEVAYTKGTTLSGVPLNVYIAVHYFSSQIKDTSLADTKQHIQKWDLDTNTFAFYERFLETKVKNIRFEEKNHMNIYNPDVRMTCEREMKIFRNKHMKLAFYAVLDRDVLTDVEFDEVNNIMKGIEIGRDKTGLVDRIVNGKPTFVHYTFAEYFAVEYMFEIFKTGPFDRQIRILDFILNDMVLYRKEGLKVMFDLKLKCTTGLGSTVNSLSVNQYIFQTLIQQCRDADPSGSGRESDLADHVSILDNIIKLKLMHFVEFLIDAMINVVDKTNLFDFLLIIKKGTFLKRLVNNGNKNLMDKIMNCIMCLDPAKCYGILESVWTNDNIPFIEL